MWCAVLLWFSFVGAVFGRVLSSDFCPVWKIGWKPKYIGLDGVQV